jgi:hypothetical protein
MITEQALEILIALTKDARHELKEEGYEEYMTSNGEVFKLTDLDEAIEEVEILTKGFGA